MSKNKQPVRKNDSVEIYLPEDFSSYLTSIIIFISAIMISGSLIYSANRISSGDLTNQGDVQGATEETTETAESGPNYEKAYTYAEEIGLNKDKFVKCVENEEFADEIATDIKEGSASGITGTPGFIIGNLNKNGNIKGTVVAGAYPYEVFDAMIKKYLGKDYDKSLLEEYEFEEGETKIDDDPYLGSRKAPVAIVEWSDYECPFCKRHALDTGKQLEENYIKKDQLLWVFKDYPLDFHNPVATKEAMIASCALKLGGNKEYFQMHDFIFENTATNKEGIQQSLQ